MKYSYSLTIVSAYLIALSFTPPSKLAFPANISPLNAVAPEASVATQFYRSLAAGIGPAKGEIHFKLLPGTTTSSINGTRDIRWTVQTETDVTVKLEYLGQVQGWKSLSMEFGPDPIIASFREGHVNAKKQRLTRIEFRKNGEPLEYFDEFHQPVGLALSGFPEVRRHIKIPNGASSLFLGQPFAGITQASVTGGLVVQQVVVLPPANVDKTVSVTLQPQTELIFAASLPGTTDTKNSIILRDASTIRIPSLQYRPDGTHTKGALGAMTFNLAEGRLGVTNTVFNLDAGLTLSFDGISFSSAAEAGAPASVTASGGVLAGRLKRASRIEVARTDLGPAQFEINSSETSSLKNLRLVSTDSPSFTISVETATLPVAGAKINVPFGDRNYLLLSVKDAPPINLSGGKSVWQSDQPPIFSGSVPAFSADALGGQIILNSQSLLKISSGQVASTGITINSTVPRPSSGAFTSARFVLASGTSLGVKDQLSALISGGTLDAATTTTPLVFDSGKEGPAGQFTLKDLALQSGNMKLGNQGTIELNSGTINALITRNPDSGVNGKVSGTLGVGTGSIELDTSNTYPINNGTLRFKDLNLSDALGLTGAVESASFSLQSTTATFSDKLMALTAPGGTFKAEDASSPLTLNGSGDLTGKSALHFQIQQGLLLMGGIFAVPLEGGTIDAQATIAGTRPLSGTLALDATTNSGTFDFNGDTKLHITRGHVKADRLAFQNPDTLTGDFNLVEFQFAESSITIPNSLLGAHFSAATLDANGGPLTIQIGPGGKVYGSYHLHMLVKTGDMKLGKVGTVGLTGGTVDLYWTRRVGQTESITANVDITIGSGSIEPIQGTHVALKGGSRLKANALTVSDNEGITGALADVDLTLGPSTVVIPDGSTLETKDGGHLTANQAASLTVPQSGSFLQGGFVLDVPFFTFYNSNDATFKLKDGRAILPLQNVADGSIIGSNCNIRGNLVITITDPDSTFDISIDVEISDGVLTRQVGKPTRLSGTLNVRIPAGLSIPKTIPQEDKGGDQHIFKVNLNIKTASDTSFTSLIILNGKNVSLCDMPAKTANLTIEVVSGNGEHPDGDFNNTNGHKAPYQEVYTDTYCAPLAKCRLHVYLIPHTYAATANLKIGLNNSKPVVDIGGLQVGENVQWDSEGCELNPCIVIAKTWRMVTGEESPDEWVNHKVRDMVSKFHYTLKQ